MHSTQKKWFTRQGGDVKGPFTLALLKSNWLLGRLSTLDEISEDRRHWQPIRDIPEFSELNAAKTLAADTDQARRYLDERDGFDRRTQHVASEEQERQRLEQRRAREPAELIIQRQLRSRILAGYRYHRERWLWPTLITILVLLGIFLNAVFYPTTIPESSADCQAAAEPGINWENCVFNPMDLHAVDLSDSNLRNSVLRGSRLLNANLTRTDLMYADLSRSDLSYAILNDAKFKGADLRQADLTNSDLKQADLSFADLRGAMVGSANLQGAILNQTIWTDGRICAPESIGDCVATDP